MPSPRRRLSPSDYARCALCGKLAEKASLVEGPEGRLVGPSCLKKALRLWGDAERLTTDTPP